MYQPMASGETNVQSANPPADLEPYRSALTELPESNKEAKGEPRHEEDECGLHEHGLRLRELLDGVEG